MVVITSWRPLLVHKPRLTAALVILVFCPSGKPSSRGYLVCLVCQTPPWMSVITGCQGPVVPGLDNGLRFGQCCPLRIVATGTTMILLEPNSVFCSEWFYQVFRREPVPHGTKFDMLWLTYFILLLSAIQTRGRAEWEDHLSVTHHGSYP